MKSEADRLLDELDDIREKRGSIGPHHPKFKKWLVAVRNHLSRRGVDKPLNKLERLGLARTGGQMWQRDDPTPTDFREFLAELDEVAALLDHTREPEEPAGGSIAVGDDAEEAAETAPRSPPAETDARGDSAMDQKMEPSPDAKKHPRALSARTQVMDKLLADLGADLKSPDADLRNIERIMADLLELKKTGQLVDQIRTEVAKPEARWEPIRELMSQLWSIKKEVVIDLLPTLVKAP